MSKLKFKIATPEKVVHEADIDSLSCPTEMGELTILANHIPLVANIVPGELRIGDGQEVQYLVVTGGFLEVRPGNEIVILADAAEYDAEIDLQRAEKAKEQAKKTMSEENVEAEEYARAQAALERSLARIRVASRKKKYRDVGKQI